MSTVYRAAAPIQTLLGPLLGLAWLLFGAGGFDDRLTALMRGVCAQRWDHSIVVQGQPLVLEARMFGIFLGFAVTVMCGWVSGRRRRIDLPARHVSIALGVGMLLMALDGVNALLADMRVWHMYEPRNDLRLVTGLVAGVGLAGFIAPITSIGMWGPWERRPYFATWVELGRSLAVVAVLGGLVWSGVLPRGMLSLVGVVAVLVSFWLVNTYVAVQAWQGTLRAKAWYELGGYSLVGSVLTAAELWGLAALRSWSEAVLGASWAV